ncbi:MAG: hypothetical protein LBE75_06575 [Burkholderiales bacterium]|jgi:outer membrane murein-binding lipoprotein Lpp|nr:hypothetical protein [Burkholderiales bacterium]
MKTPCFTPVIITAAMAATMLAGCGVETATTAATAAQLKAQEVERAQQQLEAAKREIDAAQKIMRQRIEDADRNAQAATAAP